MRKAFRLSGVGVTMTQLEQDIADLEKKYGSTKSIKTADQIMRVVAYARKKLWEEKEKKK